jgi:hypothetical protein
MNSTDIFYDLLLCKTQSQVFYNDIMVRMVNPMARDLFRTFRDEDEKEVLKIRKIFLNLEARPSIFKSFIRRKA